MTQPDDAPLAPRCESLYRRYARAVDDGDVEGLRAFCLDDVRLTRGADATLEGVEAFLDIYRAHVGKGVPLTRHVITNVVAERVADGISSRAYFQAWFYEETRTRVVSGTYDDLLVERDGGELVFAHKVNNVERILELPTALIS
jgi:3-phenylpropionate/cinnamic acid dioxygenase small subunit